MDVQDFMEQDARERSFRKISDDGLKTVAELARKQLLLEEQVAVKAQELSNLQSSLSMIREVDLPNALESFGISSVKLIDGSVVTVKEDVYAGITEEHREAAFQWLENTDNDGIIKNEIKCPFGKGQDNDAKILVDLLNVNGYSFTNNRSVHPQTLKAFVRKQLQDGLPIPTDIFSIHIKKIANIITPKK